MAVTQRVINANGRKIKAHINASITTAAVADRIVGSASMKVGAYTIAAQPYAPSKITVATTASGTADTQGTVVIVGTDIYDRTITETLTPVAGSTVTGTKYFKTITSVTGVGWVIDAGAGNDTIVVGVPQAIGIEAYGHKVSLYVITGNMWFNENATALATVASIPLIAGDSVEDLMVSEVLSVISDGSGGTFYAIIWDE